jgi:translation initiation factor IF-2
MTDDIKVTRLSKAAREFNVGISTIVEFLHKKGFDLDPNPNTKLPPDAYKLLVKEYSTDISVKKESEKLILKDLHRKKESVSIDDVPEKSEHEEAEKDDNILVKDSTGKLNVDIKTEVRKPDIKLIGKIDLDKTLKPKADIAAPQKEEPVHKAPAAPGEPKKPEKEKLPSEKEKVPAASDADKKAKTDTDIHVVGKIDLGAIRKETKTDEKEKPGEKLKKEPGTKEKAEPDTEEKESMVSTKDR